MHAERAEQHDTEGDAREPGPSDPLGLGAQAFVDDVADSVRGSGWGDAAARGTRRKQEPPAWVYIAASSRHQAIERY